jgi:hypothetical protein
MKIVASVALVILFLALPATVLALGMEKFGNAPVGKQPEWAEGIVDVVNLKSRVYSWWVNGNENFFYRGNAQDLNEALRQYAAVKDEVRQLILLPGSGKTSTFDRKPVEFDWQLHVPSGIYRAASKRKHAVMTVYVNALKPRAPKDRKQIDQWLADLNDDSFQKREKAKQELQKVGNDAKPFLREALKAQPPLEARRRIEALLDKLRDFDVSDLEIPKGLTIVTVDDLLAVHFKGLKDPDRTVSGMAIQDLSRFSPYSDKVVPAITEMLKKDKHEWVRRVAAGCLSSIGVNAKSALPELKKGLEDPDVSIRKTFQPAIEQIENAREQPGEAAELKRKLSIRKEINELKKAVEGK